MGKKKELKEDLALARSAASQLEQENQLLRAQLAEGVPAPPFRMITDAPPTPVRAQIAMALGIDPASYQGGVTDEMILEAVERLRNPQLGGDDFKDALVVTKGDSLAEAIHHNKAERSTLETSLRQARNIINRVAGALGVGQWNADGDELVEKAQRFGVFHYWLRKRLREAELDADGSVLAEEGNIRAIELRTILAALIGDKEMARILQNKPVKASKTVLELAENPAPNGITYLDRPFAREDVLWIRDALKKVHTGADPHRSSQLMLVFERLASSEAATEELVSWINAVVLPLLRKQHPAYQSIPKEN